jgi:hypothetical protein
MNIDRGFDQSEPLGPPLQRNNREIQRRPQPYANKQVNLDAKMYPVESWIRGSWRGLAEEHKNDPDSDNDLCGLPIIDLLWPNGRLGDPSVDQEPRQGGKNHPSEPGNFGDKP